MMRRDDEGSCWATTTTHTFKPNTIDRAHLLIMAKTTAADNDVEWQLLAI